MASDVKEIWKEALKLLQEEMTSVSFSTWIEPIFPVSLENNLLTLEVPSEFNLGIINSRYKDLIQNAIRVLTKRDLNIELFVKSAELPKEDQTPNQDQLSSYISVLNPKYTFDTFVRGSGNQLAHAAALAVAESPATAYNPLFIYGGVGLGKTHLMHAIGHFIIEQNPSRKVIYTSSEKFTNELINAIKDDRNEEFRNKYRNIDVLLIDDIQFIGGKERTQEEFFHTFNALYEASKQIVLSSDKPPKEILTLEERLRSRFEWGLIADIQAPDIETRIAILRKKSQQERYDIPDEVLSYIAENIESNIRELEGALNRVIAYASLTGSPITLDLAKNCLKQLLAGISRANINHNTIMKVVSRYYDISPDQLVTKKRSRDISHPRQVAMYLCRELTDMSLPKIGQVFGGRDHTTVMHACEKIQDSIDNNNDLRRTIMELKRNITGKI
ncbi:MAG: chromosomal replication initiator protein DnaA [Clostridiaceae bacterium]|jgi:chromosomal replication initiator protein|nr:chromosomal replication initiator protein DnaA [Clostridiaceae bacterium]